MQFPLRGFKTEDLVDYEVSVFVGAMPISELGEIQFVAFEIEQLADANDLVHRYGIGCYNLLGQFQPRAVERFVGNHLIGIFIVLRVHAYGHRRHEMWRVVMMPIGLVVAVMWSYCSFMAAVTMVGLWWHLRHARHGCGQDECE